MSTIYFDEFKYFSFTKEISAKKLENRQIIITRNIGLAPRRFAIKYDTNEKNFYITDDYKTLGDDITKDIINKRLENLKGIADLFNYHEFHIFGVLNNKNVYFHNFKINGVFFDYEDYFELFRNYDLEMDPPIYKGIFSQSVIDSFYETFNNITIFTENLLAEEKTEPLFYILKKEKVLPMEVKNLYVSAITKFLETHFDNVEGKGVIDKFLDSKYYKAVSSYNAEYIKKLLIPFIYDTYNIELKVLVKENNFVLPVFEKTFRSIFDEFFNKLYNIKG